MNASLPSDKLICEVLLDEYERNKNKASDVFIASFLLTCDNLDTSPKLENTCSKSTIKSQEKC